MRERRQADVDAMDRLLAWCDHHSVAPQSEPGAVPGIGGDRLVTIGGEGTPPAAELCFEEFAIAAHAGVVATTNRAADLLDLRHRLPNVYDAVRALRLELWVARKVASMSRRLDRDRVTIVEDEAKKGVWLRRKRPGERAGTVVAEADVQGLGMRLSSAGAEGLAEFIDLLAGVLADQHIPSHPDDVRTMDQFRAEARRPRRRPRPPRQPARPRARPARPPPGARSCTEEASPPRDPQHLPQPGRPVRPGRRCRPGRGDRPPPPRAARRARAPPRDHRRPGHRPHHRTRCQRLRAPHLDETPHPAPHQARRVSPTPPAAAPASSDHDHPTPYDPTGPPGQTTAPRPSS